jgi:C1A family cysteine protease
MKNIFTIVIGSLLTVFLSSCPKSERTPIPEAVPSNTGWKSDENYSQSIPVAVNYTSLKSNQTLPGKIDLTSSFPPIGDQGRLGTCVAWAVGYNTKSYLDGNAKQLSPAQLASADNQYSPSDLFYAIEYSKRSCAGGTYFEDAFNVLINRGVNTLRNFPYDGNYCQNSPGSSNTASANKIKNFRRIGGSVDEVKGYLAQGIPVVIGAMVNSEFQRFTGSGVLRGLNYALDQGGGHAMVIAGYDDARSAFRIINSWGPNWADNGYIWIDYDFLVNQFCNQGGRKSLFVAFNDNNPTVNPPTPSTGKPDLTAFVTADYSVGGFARQFHFDLKNVGDQTILASTKCSIYYLWVNAFDANNYGVILKGEFTSSIPTNTYQNINSNYCLINYDIPPGTSLSQAMNVSGAVSWIYQMPAVTGYYYLVLFLDKGNSSEENQTNNIFYVTQTPKYFYNGYSERGNGSFDRSNKYNFEDLQKFKHSISREEALKDEMNNSFRSLSNKEFTNAYTSDEIRTFLQFKAKNGGL